MLFTTTLSLLSIPAALAGSRVERQLTPPVVGLPPGNELWPNGDPYLCLNVRGGVAANGTPVEIATCDFTTNQRWAIKQGSTKVQWYGTNFCLDAGSAPSNGVLGKIWQCYANLPAQQWYYTWDNRIALENQGFCLDLPNGNLTSGQPVQIWQCADFDVNQIWTLY